MHSSKIYSIISGFDKYEQNRCRKYIQSPFFNKSGELIKLFDVLVANIEGETHSTLSKEEIWKKINGRKAYDDTRFRKYVSDLMKLIEGFMIQKEFDEDPLSQATLFMEAVGKRKIEKLYNSAMKNAKKVTDKYPYQPARYYYHQYDMENKYYELTQFNMRRTQKSNVDRINANLDYFYLAEKLRLYLTVKSRQYVVSHEYDLLFIDEVINHVKKLDFEEIPPIAMYYQMHLAQKEDDKVEHYFELKRLIDKFFDKFPPKEAYFIYSEAMNYCIRKVNKGNFNFLKELFTLYKDLLRNGLIFTEDKLSPWDFKNITNCALRLKEYEWTEWFINSYKEKLSEMFRDNAVTFNLAQLYYYQHKYDDVIEKLKDVEFDDFSYNLTSKTMLIATYYELDEIEPLYSLLESFRTYLNRHKEIPSQRRQYYLNTIRIVKRLSRVIPGDDKNLTKVKEEFETKKSAIGMEGWIQEKIRELEGV